MTNYPMTYDFQAKAIFAASAQMLIFSMCLHMWEPDPSIEKRRKGSQRALSPDFFDPWLLFNSQVAKTFPLIMQAKSNGREPLSYFTQAKEPPNNMNSPRSSVDFFLRLIICNSVPFINVKSSLSLEPKLMNQSEVLKNHYKKSFKTFMCLFNK